MERKIWLSFRLDRSDFSQLQKLARRLGSTRSAIVRHALKLGLKELQGAEWVEDQQTSKEKK